MRRPLYIFVVALQISATTTAFCPRPPPWASQQQRQQQPLHMNFFKDLLGEAFENDTSLNRDKSKGQLEGPNSTANTDRLQPTKVQQAWRERMNSAGSSGSVTPALVENSKFQLDLFLAGVPSKDPSNDLYGSKTNISSRDKSVGLDVPDEPSVSALKVEFLPNGVCQCEESPFTSGKRQGEWKLLNQDQDDKTTMLRFSMDVLGYSRTIQTKGSITKIYWSKEEEKTLSTSTVYTIPPGWVYGDVELGTSGSNPGTLVMKEAGILRIEKTMGLLGAASKLVACGKFNGKQVFD